MSVTMDDSIKRWTAKRKAALVVEIIQGKTTVAEASRAFDMSPSEIEGWVDDAKRGMENALRVGWQVDRVYHSEIYSDHGKHTNWAESYFSRLRRMVQGQHHHVSPRYLHQYATQAAWLEDNRHTSPSRTTSPRRRRLCNA